MPKRILIECTPTFSTDMVTGIQRVVRSLVVQGIQSTDFDVHAVIIRNARLFALAHDAFEISSDKHTEQCSHRTWLRYMQAMAQSRWVINSKDALRVRFFSVFSRLKNLYFKMLLKAKISTQQKMVELQPTQGDILVMADVNWGRDEIWPLLQDYRERGVKVVFVLYDLIPIHYPQFCGESRQTEFEQFVISMLNHSDGVLSISKAVEDDLISYVNDQERVEERLSKDGLPRLHYFYLGVNFPKFSGCAAFKNPLLEQTLSSKQAVFLTVSTIEPRKNHAFMLDVFERLWANGSQIKWIIVGRVGWMMSDFIERIEAHPRYNQNLFMFNDLNDAELVYCYQQATALVFPSVIEGFGLPIIEALHYSLPVVASDIAIHREIGRDRIMYAKLNNVDEWADLIAEIARNGVSKNYLPEEFDWMNWQQATDQFLKKVLEVAK